jgi:DNA-binding HxlR family transcriptional regulator
VGSPPQTTLRKHLKSLTGLGILTRCQAEEFPAPVSYDLSDSGRELLAAASILDDWLTTSPEGPLLLGDAAAKSATRALVDGWTTKIIRALAAKPLSLTELDRLLSGVNYPALERRLAAMRLAGQIVRGDGRCGSTPYKVTRWLREAVAPLMAAASWERSHASGKAGSPGRLDFEAAFLLVVPLVPLPSTLRGTCRLTVEFLNGDGALEAGVTVAIDSGRPVSCVSNSHAGAADGSAAGTDLSWLSALGGRDETGIEFSGDRELAEALIVGLRRVLFRPGEHGVLVPG